MMTSEIETWSERNRIEVIYDSNWRYYLPATPEDLARFEKKARFQFPAAYRTLATTIGAGQLANYFRFLTPFAKDPAIDLVEYNSLEQAELKQMKKSAGPVDHQAQLQRMVHFCTNYMLHSFAWDPQDVTDAQTHEYGIYFVSRRRDQPPKRVAASFDEFIETFCLGGGYEQTLGVIESAPENLDRTFFPHQNRQYFPRKLGYRQRSQEEIDAEMQQETRQEVDRLLQAVTVANPDWNEISEEFSEFEVDEDQKLVSVNLCNINLQGSDLLTIMQSIANETALNSLHLGPGLTDELLRHVHDNRSLKELRLGPPWLNADTEFHGSGLKYLEGLSELKRLYIECPQLTEEGFSHLPSLPGLTATILSEMNIGDRSFQHLAERCPALERIQFFHTKLMGTTFACLRELKDLKKLNVGNSCVTDQGLATLPTLEGLTFLGLGSSPITDAGLAPLEQLPNLEILDLCDTKVTDKGVEILQKLKSLKKLWLFESKVSKRGKRKLKEALPDCEIK